METIHSCFICKKEDFDLYLQAKDTLCTDESFDIVKCRNCSLLLTNPRPPMDEIGKYYASDDYLSHSERNVSFVQLIYNTARRINIKRKLKILPQNSNTKKNLLDYGCGAGSFLQAAAEKGWDVTGVDVNEKALSIARKKGLNVFASEKIFTMQAHSFDAVTLWHVLEHVHDIKPVFLQLKKLLKEKGKLIVALPNIDSWDAKKYKQQWAGYDVPRHLYHFSEYTFGLFAEKMEMKITAKYPMKFDAYYICLLSESKSKLKYLKAFINAFRSNYAGRKNTNYSGMIYLLEKR